MTNGIIDGISMALDAEFNAEADSYEIYTELVEQGMEKPCFSILLLNSDMRAVLPPRYYTTNQFCVHFFPKSKDEQSECLSVKERLWDCLEYVTAGDDLIRGTEMNAEIREGVLYFFVNYDFYVKKPIDKENAMETIETSVNAKE